MSALGDFKFDLRAALEPKAYPAYARPDVPDHQAPSK